MLPTPQRSLTIQTPFHTDQQLITLLQAQPQRFEEIISHGTPLINPDSLMHTFVFEAPETDAVHLWINRITDKERAKLGAMKQIPGTNFWVLTIAVPHSLTAAYCFRIGSKVQHPPGYNNYPHCRDPHARFGQLIVDGEHGLSLLLGRDATISPWWRDIDHGTPANQLIQSRVGQCATHLYSPSQVYHRLPLVILPDGDVWFRRLKLEQALDRAISAGYLPPVAVAGIGFNDSQHRRDLLTNFDSWHSYLTQSVIPWVREESAAPNRVILAGQSLGGLAALGVGLNHPADFSAVIAQSPSLWWHDSPDASPRDFPKQVIPWIVGEALAHAGSQHPKAYLDVGIREGLSVAHMHGLSTAMTSAGWQHELGFVDGGHDYAWWRETLLRRLSQALTP